jgi:deazaflavin-dependent oxidoreductase (nitroreductase family)
VIRLLKYSESLKNEKFVYLTTKGRKSGINHEVELWFAISGDNIYLSHEGKHTDWIKNLLKNPNIKLKIGKDQIEGDGRIAELGSPGRDAGMQALYEKYYGQASKETLDDWFELSTVIEITPK